MAIADAPRDLKLPEKVGDCCHCQLALYASAPLVSFPDGRLAHVACEIDARRQNRGG